MMAYETIKLFVLIGKEKISQHQVTNFFYILFVIYMYPLGHEPNISTPPPPGVPGQLSRTYNGGRRRCKMSYC